MDYAVRHLPSASPVLEVGSFCGLSANILTHLLDKYKRPNRLYSCDPWAFQSFYLPDLNRTGEEYSKFCRETFIRNLRFFNGHRLPATVELPSNEFYLAWKAGRTVEDVFGRPAELGGPLSFCFIDGSHSYDQVRLDFENCDAFLERGGFVLFDDSADGSGWDVCRVIAEVKRGGSYQVVGKNPNYLFRKT